MDQVDERSRRELTTTRILYMVWAALGIAVVLVLCYLVFSMMRSRAPQSVVIGQAEDFPANSITLKFVNADFSDPETNKEFATLSLEVVREPAGNFTVFFARSTNPAFGSLTPRQCVVQWDEPLKRFVEPCGGAKWTREGKYAEGPAPRDLDRFPAQVMNGDLTIRLDLAIGAANP